MFHPKLHDSSTHLHQLLQPFAILLLSFQELSINYLFSLVCFFPRPNLHPSLWCNELSLANPFRVLVSLSSFPPPLLPDHHRLGPAPSRGGQLLDALHGSHTGGPGRQVCREFGPSPAGAQGASSEELAACGRWEVAGARFIFVMWEPGRAQTWNVW